MTFFSFLSPGLLLEFSTGTMNPPFLETIFSIFIFFLFCFSWTEQRKTVRGGSDRETERQLQTYFTAVKLIPAGGKWGFKPGSLCHFYARWQEHLTNWLHWVHHCPTPESYDLKDILCGLESIVDKAWDLIPRITGVRVNALVLSL